MYVNAICLPRARRAPARLGKSEKTESGCNALPSTHDHAVVVPGAARVLVSRLGSTRPRAIARPFGRPGGWGPPPSLASASLWQSRACGPCLGASPQVGSLKFDGHLICGACVWLRLCQFGISAEAIRPPPMLLASSRFFHALRQTVDCITPVNRKSVG